MGRFKLILLSRFDISQRSLASHGPRECKLGLVCSTKLYARGNVGSSPNPQPSTGFPCASGRTQKCKHLGSWWFTSDGLKSLPHGQQGRHALKHTQGPRGSLDLDSLLKADYFLW